MTTTEVYHDAYPENGNRLNPTALKCEALAHLLVHELELDLGVKCVSRINIFTANRVPNARLELELELPENVYLFPFEGAQITMVHQWPGLKYTTVHLEIKNVQALALAAYHKDCITWDEKEEFIKDLLGHTAQEA